MIAWLAVIIAAIAGYWTAYGLKEFIDSENTWHVAMAGGAVGAVSLIVFAVSGHLLYVCLTKRD